MKKTWKYSIISFCILLVVFVFLAIQVYAKKTILTSYYPITSTAVYDVSISEIENTLGIQKEWLKTHHVLSSLLLPSSERILLLECKEEYKEEVIQKAHGYLDTLKKQYKNSEQLKIIEKYQEYIKDNYYILVISENADSIMKDIKKRLS